MGQFNLIDNLIDNAILFVKWVAPLFILKALQQVSKILSFFKKIIPMHFNLSSLFRPLNATCTKINYSILNLRELTCGLFINHDFKKITLQKLALHTSGSC